ncbi:MAG: hypothetical protein KC777_27865 [Cyanobacteria bacterium HKST-UBA02]|nr:hypothetical protein [Cyanobacteria bacterium HKST-UBA02]
MNVDQDLKLNFGNLGEGDSAVFREPPERLFEGAIAGAVVSKIEEVRGWGTPALVLGSPGYLAIIWDRHCLVPTLVFLL